MIVESLIVDEVPSYSTRALNTLHEFHDCICMMFVEGQDDVIFWETICECAQVTGVRIESVGGRTQLEERIRKIAVEGACVIVACDADYFAVLKNGSEHPQIVRTHGYSIENTMYCASSLNRFARKLARSRADFTLAAQDWIDRFCADSRRLLVYDIANERYGKGVSILGDTCSRFLVSKRADTLSPALIETFLQSLNGIFSEAELEQCERLVSGVPHALPALIKGHFLTLGAMNWIKRQMPKQNQSISLDHLYTSTVDSCRGCSRTVCQEIKAMSEAVKIAFNEAKTASNAT